MSSVAYGDHSSTDVSSPSETLKPEDGSFRQSISFSFVRPVDIRVRGLGVEVDVQTSFVDVLKGGFSPRQRLRDLEDGFARRKKILMSVSANFPRGSLSAIIGGSGSGKTTFLNHLSHRMRGSNLAVSGTVLYNESLVLSSFSNAYVTQTDVLLPELSVRETLEYAASLRLPRSTTTEHRSRLVEEVILELGLKECADTRVGDGLRQKDCSGGERRRVSIGVQMLGNPSILFLDEPTTGLDATSAFHLINTLRQLASNGRTIIITIHQPRSDIFFLFDNITLLSKGNCVYSGPMKECLPWFDTLLPGGLKPHVNPADHLIDISTVDNRTPDAEVESRIRVDRLLMAWKGESKRIFGEGQDDTTEPKSALAISVTSADFDRVQGSASLWHQIYILTHRFITVTIRDPIGLIASVVEATLMGITCGLIYYHISKSSSGIRSRQNALYTSSATQVYVVIIFETFRLTTSDMALFDRERGEGVIGVFAWMVSRRIAHGMLEDITVPVLFSIISYLMCGFDTSILKFGTYFSVVLLQHWVAISFALIAAAISRDFSLAILFTNLVCTLQIFGSGYFVQAATIPVYVKWIKWISFVFYGFGALCSNEFTDSYYDCPSGDARTDPACIQYRGNFVLQNLSFPRNWRVVPLCALLGFVIVATVASGLLLQFWTVDIHFASSKKAQIDDSSPTKEIIQKQGGGKSVKRVDVDLIDYALRIYKPSLRGPGRVLDILKGVTTRFEGGELNVIMGPSGSGKSSLLNLMARRLHSSPSTRYHSSGAMLLNGSRPSDSVVRSLCSYVTQDDSGLLPYLTVREMLRFAAGLRLPRWMSKQEKHQRAEEMILKLGLKDCADNLIGNELIKGISGGEKRRVSIAVQVLTEPQILILDEPTSGLDAFTAFTILQVLKGLVSEGRTVIATIHQSRSDLFSHFGNVLLLTKGGELVYSGKAERVVPYFSDLGYECPSTFNPADFVLDLVSVDSRDEACSREKVRSLTDRFKPEELMSANDTHTTISLPVEMRSLKRDTAPFHVAYPILLRRGIINITRQPNLSISRIGQALGTGIFIALFFAPLKNDYVSIQNRVGCIRSMLSLYVIGMLQNVALYPNERDVFYKEHDDRAYSVESFFFAYLTLELPFEILSGLMFAALGAAAVNLQRTVWMYLVVAFCSFCLLNCGESVGIIFNTVCRSSTGFALNVANAMISMALLMGGILAVDMPQWVKIINYASPIPYGVAVMMIESFSGQQFTCTSAQQLPDGSCLITNGQQVLQMFSFNVRFWPQFGWLVVSTVTYRILAYAVLKVARLQLDVTKGRKGK